MAGRLKSRLATLATILAAAAIAMLLVLWRRLRLRRLRRLVRFQTIVRQLVQRAYELDVERDIREVREMERYGML